MDNDSIIQPVPLIVKPTEEDVVRVVNGKDIYNISMPKAPTQNDIDDAKRAGDKRRNGFTDAKIIELRNMCKHDLFFLSTAILGYEKLAIDLHGSLCAWLERHRDIQYRLILLPRSHYKSTIVTVGDSIQTALPDDLKNCIYPHNLGTNVRICISHDIAEMAQKFLRIITNHFCTNPLLIALFPECVPDSKRNRINIKELELPRTAAWAESTFDTMGVGARGQGNHYNKLKCDDIYGESARDSKSEAEAHKQWFDNIQSFLLTPATDHIDIVGTRWSFDDVYAHAMKSYIWTDDDGKEHSQILKYIRSVYTTDSEGKQVPIFPEQFTLKSLEILKRNRKVWNAQYINNPTEGSASFEQEWKRYYNRIGRRDIQIFLPKSPFEDGGSEEISFEELDRVVFVDPALEGLSGICVTGMDSKKRIFVLEAIKKVYKTTGLRDQIFSLVLKYNPRVVVIEEVLFSRLYEDWFKAEMKIRGMHFRIELVKTGQKEKGLRVNGLANYFQAGQIYFHPSQTNLITEFDEFGATEDYHILDAMAYGPKIWKAGNRLLSGVNTAPAIENDTRNIRTGYSKIR